MVGLISTSDHEWRCLSFERNCCAILVKELHVNTKIWFYRVSNPQEAKSWDSEPRDGKSREKGGGGSPEITQRLPAGIMGVIEVLYLILKLEQ